MMMMATHAHAQFGHTTN